jgi:hypothetical protein
MKKDYEIEGGVEMSCKNKYGEWVPSIPLPYYLAWGRVRCNCGRKFKGEEAYEGHYALDHIMGLPYTGPKAF